MTDYTITTNFGAKDSLPSGNAGKVIIGEEFTTEFTNIQTAVNTKADTAGDTFTGAVNFSADVAVNTNTLFVDVSEANVGIGTSSPTEKLQVNGNIKIGDSHIIGNDAFDNLTLISSSPEGIVYGSNTDHIIKTGATGLSATGTERMRITSSGNVGIGEANPTQKLQVDGNIRLGDTAVGVDDDEDYNITSGGQLNIHANDSGENQNYVALNLKCGNANGSEAASSRIACFVNDDEKMRIDSSGNVGIGTATPSFKTDINVNSTSANDTQIALRVKSTTTADMTNDFGVSQLFSVEDSSGTNFNIAQLRAVRDGADDSGAFAFAPYSTGTATERMRISSSGNLLVGTTDRNTIVSNGASGVAIGGDGFIGASRTAEVLVLNREDSDGNIAEFRKDGTTVGSIGTAFVSGSRYFYIGSTANNVNTGIGFYDQGIYASNSTGSFSSGNKNLGSSTVRWLTAYLTNSPNVSSDQRLKQNIEDADDAGSTIDAIQVRKFDWIEDGRHQKYGMIAQELAEVYPEAVNVPENEEDTLGIATGDLIPMLIKEVQSLRSRVAELENV